MQPVNPETKFWNGINHPYIQNVVLQYQLKAKAMNYDDFTNYENEMPWENNSHEGNNDSLTDVTRIMEEDHYDAYNFFPDAGF